MVGFVKQLIDEQAAADVLRLTLRNPPGRPSKFKNMLIVPGIVFVRKAGLLEPAQIRTTPSSSHVAQ